MVAGLLSDYDEHLVAAERPALRGYEGGRVPEP